MTTLRRSMHATLLLVVALALVATACTSSPDTEQGSPVVGPESHRLVEEVTVASGAPMTIDVGSGMSISVDEGDLAESGVVRTRSVDVDLPEVAGFTPAGPPVEIDFAATLAAPVTLGFEGANGPRDAIPVVYRLDPDLGWYPVAFGEPGAPAMGERQFFSVHLPGWINPREWADSAIERFRGRTDPPTCEDAPPSWATVSGPPVDILLACGTSNDADDGAERVEVRIKNNRGLMSQVALPAGLDFAFVEGQPEVIRAAIRRLAGDRDVALLPSGSFMSLGFRRPASSTTRSITPEPSQLAMVIDLFQAATDLSRGQQALSNIHLGALALENCGLGRRALFDQPDSLGDFTALATEIGACLISFARDPGKAATIAAEAVAAINGIDVAVATGDRAFASQVDRLAGALRFGGSTFKGVALASMVHRYFEFSAEQLSLNTGDAVDQDLVSVTVEMRSIGLDLTDPTLRLSVEGLGPVKLGMSLEEGRRAAGVPSTIHRNPAYCGTLTPDHVEGITFFALPGGDNTIQGIGITNEQVLTVSGIHVGSALEKLRQTYKGDLSEGHYDILGVEPGAVYRPSPDSEYAMAFSIDEGLVSYIHVLRAEYLNFVEYCA